MAQLKAPENFIVIRSEDRQSALFVWDSVVQNTDGDLITAHEYNLNRSELHNGLGYSIVKEAILHKMGEPRQFTSLDGLDPDLLYNFTVVAAESTQLDSDPSIPATDF